MNRPEFLTYRIDDADVPQRTPDGKPWVRWVTTGEDEGWFAQGTRSPDEKKATGFWPVLLAVAARARGTRFDQVAALGSGIISMGALGVTFRSGYAQLLLEHCLIAQPMRFTDTMAPVFHATGAHPRRTRKAASGVALVDTAGHLLLTEDEIRRCLLLGATGSRWTVPQKDRGRLWVSTLSMLLRDERQDAAQAAFAAKVLPGLVRPDVLQALRWPRDGAEQTWQYTREHQAVWAIAFLLAMRETKISGDLLADAVEGVARGSDEHMALLRILRKRLPGAIAEGPQILDLVTTSFGVIDR